MKTNLVNFERDVERLLRCFSIPSNRDYVLTEAGVALKLNSEIYDTQSEKKDHEIIVYKDKRLHTLFSIWSNKSQKQFVSNHVQFAMLTLRDTSDIENNLLLTIDCCSPQLDLLPVLLSVNFNLHKNDIEVISVSADSTEMDEKQLHQLPLILSLILPT